MDKVIGRLTVFFEDPFWVGVFERIENGRLSAAKVTFGAEPKGAGAADLPAAALLPIAIQSGC